MIGYKSMALRQLLALAGAASMLCVNGFVPATFGTRLINTELAAATVKGDVDTRTGKPTGTSFLPAETLERAKEGNKIEKQKIEKDGTSAWVDIYEYAAKIRAGELDWKDIEGGDMNTRFKFAGLLHRDKRTPGQFMMRLKVPNGIINSDQLRFYADSVEKYGTETGVIDITTRANIQLRGVKVEDAPDIIDGLHARNQTSIQSALDSVRNMVGNPLAGIDDKEMVDTREFANALNDLVSLDPVTNTRGNPAWGNLPRKFNIAISGSRDDFAHTHINDIGLQPCPHGETGVMGFNVVLGGYMSIKRVAESIDSNMWIPADRNSVVTLCEAILRIFRDESDRKDRQKARLMWLVEKYGVEEFKKAVVAEVESYNRGVKVEDFQPRPTEAFERRELLGVHPQPQEGKVRVGIFVPAGRLSQTECKQIAYLADMYSGGEVRLTVEQNVILPNVDEDKVEELLNENALNGDSRLKINPGLIEGNVVSCTGAQFCGLALIETKSHAESVAKKLESLVTVDRPIRIHWTGCPNSCGQVQVADIGIMGAPAKKEDPDTGMMKAVPGCKIFVGGKIGEEAHLALEPEMTGIPLAEEDLVPVLVDILKEKFGAKDKGEKKKWYKFWKKAKKQE
jgi:ferredoxin-nitrite reductase